MPLSASPPPASKMTQQTLDYPVAPSDNEAVEEFQVEEAATRDLVQHGVETADITPVLRLMFDATSAQQGKPEAGNKVASMLKTCLEHYANEQEKVIREVCRSHALEVAQFVAEVSHLRDSVEELQIELDGSMDNLQVAGSKLVETSGALNQLLATQENVALARSVLRSARTVLGKCLEVGQLIEQHHLHQALCLLNTVRNELLPAFIQLLLPPSLQQQPSRSGPTASKASRSSIDRLQDVAMATDGPVRQDLAGLVHLEGFFQGLIDELSTTVEAMAIADFHDWLVAVRAEARNIGLTAIKAAAQQRALEEQFARERKVVLAHLTQNKDTREAAQQLVSTAQFRAELLAESRAQLQPPASTPGQTDGSARTDATPTASPQKRMSTARSRRMSRAVTLPPDDPANIALLPRTTSDAIAALLRQRQQSGASASTSSRSPQTSDTASSPLAGVDMRRLHRCVHIHAKLSKLQGFQQRYQEQRQLQISTDLQPPANFLESYQAYLAQVVGFFMVEDSVQRLTEDLVTQQMVHSLWESAAATVSKVLDRALESMGSAAVMLLVKEFALQLCAALTQCGYNVSPLQEVLLDSRQHYHQLLSSSIEGQVTAVLEADVLLDYEVRSAQSHAELSGSMGLPQCLEGQRPLGVPYLAPYTSSIPSLLRIVRSFITDSISYLRGLFSPWELPATAMQHRDRMLSKLVADALAAKVAVVNSSEFLRETMKMVSNVWAMIQALDALDAWTLQQVSGEPEAAPSSTGGHASPSKPRRHRGQAAGDSNTSTVQASMRAVQDAGERNMLRIISGRTQAVMGAAKTFNWLPVSPLPQAVSPHVEQLLGFLQETFDSAQRLLPRSSYTLLTRTVMKSTAAMVMKLFGPEGIKGYNLFAMQRLASDTAAMQRFASRCGVADLEEVFAEPCQLCALLLSDSIEEILVPEVRKMKYAALELAVVATVLDKYREVLTYDRPPKPTNFAKKRAVEAVAKQLRTQMLNGAVLRSNYTDDD